MSRVRKLPLPACLDLRIGELEEEVHRLPIIHHGLFAVERAVLSKSADETGPCIGLEVQPLLAPVAQALEYRGCGFLQWHGAEGLKSFFNEMLTFQSVHL